MRLILASSSPRRAELLTSAGFAFDVSPAEVDETLWEAEEPGAYALRVARDKAATAAAKHADGAVVLAADTVVVARGEILGKPRDAGDAERMLRRLSDAVHEVLTAVVVRAADGETSEVVTTRVHFLRLTRCGDCLVCRLRRAGREGRRLRHPGPRGPVHRPDRGLLVECRGPPDCDGLPPAEPGP